AQEGCAWGGCCAARLFFAGLKPCASTERQGDTVLVYDGEAAAVQKAKALLEGGRGEEGAVGGGLV
ncbi:MAG TPA: hypothetical protein VL913_01005, partial [Candidatus Micrarchaeaceae archaeon]|nr:hypothetical protein [Candidatus Micrarchaeaceae archaeon]